MTYFKIFKIFLSETIASQNFFNLHLLTQKNINLKWNLFTLSNNIIRVRIKLVPGYREMEIKKQVFLSLSVKIKCCLRLPLSSVLPSSPSFLQRISTRHLIKYKNTLCKTSFTAKIFLIRNILASNHQIPFLKTFLVIVFMNLNNLS